jgi:hypothetical protein
VLKPPTQDPPETTVDDSLPVDDSPVVEDSLPVASVALVEAELGALLAASSFAAEPLDAVDLAASVAVELAASVVVEAALTVCPEKVPAATAESAPVAVTLPAISQRLMRVSLRSAASLDFMFSLLDMSSVLSAWIRAV